MQELGIATLTACFVNSNRDPKKSQAAKPKDFFYFAPREGVNGVRISASAANTFFSLVLDNLIPGWAVGIAPIQRLRECKTGGGASKPRAWIGEGIVLIAPKISGDEVEFDLGFIDGAEIGVNEVRDADTETAFFLDLPALEPQWILEGEFKLVEMAADIRT